MIMRKKQGGFTIVELLIVIVVIAILAAISVVAYNGIQTRAENTKTIQGVTQYVKAIQGYAALKGNYPVDPAWPCLGPSGTICARRTGTNTCPLSGDGSASSTSNFATLLGEVMSSELPKLSDQSITCNGNTYTGGYYRGTTGTAAEVAFYLKGNQPCDRIGGLVVGRTQHEDATRCQLSFPTL